MEHRICKLCKLDIENEIHFLWECPVLETSRHDIIKGTWKSLKILNIQITNQNLFGLCLLKTNIYDKPYKLLDNLFTLRQEKLNKMKFTSSCSVLFWKPPDMTL
jgi:hypothetical protein